ncbi:MAG: FkbM family methyltransferase [Planctomycetaceae bacterium]
MSELIGTATAVVDSRVAEIKPAASLPWVWRMLAAFMRLWPTDVRRVDMLWHALYRRIGGGPYFEVEEIDRNWPTGLQPGVRGRHGQLMFLDLQDWSDRRAYFSGRFYQQDIDRLLTEVLRPGDQYLDVGANIGMTMLTAAGRIGPEGRGFVFEPNPVAIRRLTQHLEENRLINFEAVPAALSDVAGTSRLFLTGSHTGIGSLNPLENRRENFVEIRTVVGNDFAPKLDPARPTVIKIDVEGHEVQALSAMSAILARPEVVVIAEISDSMLRQAGHSREILHRHMAEHGFEAFRVELVSARWEKLLELFPAEGRDQIPKYDAVFVRPESRIFERVAPFVKRAGASIHSAGET